MRCKSCDELLTKQEDTRKSLITGDYIQLCNICLLPIMEDIPESIDENDDIWDDVDATGWEVPEPEDD